MTIKKRHKEKRKQSNSPAALAPAKITQLILWLRGEKVMLDRDLARLYGVETKVLKQAVRRNIDRFPEDFMFILTKTEFDNWRSQFVTSNSDRMGLRYSPMAFTEQGVAMLSSVLHSTQAVQVNIAIMRTFVQIRHMMDANRELARKINSLEQKYDEQFEVVFRAIQQLITSEEAKPPKKKIGFHVDEQAAKYKKKRVKRAQT